MRFVLIVRLCHSETSELEYAHRRTGRLDPRQLTAKQLTDDGNVDITGCDLRAPSRVGGSTLADADRAYRDAGEWSQARR